MKYFKVYLTIILLYNIIKDVKHDIYLNQRG